MDQMRKFKEICEECPEICEDMAKGGYILDIDMIKTCQKRGIKFRKEFVKMIETINAKQ
jgi:hypothetical protein